MGFGSGEMVIADARRDRAAWALILGASSGFGEAAALELAGVGMNIVGVHLDRKSTMGNLERITGEIKAKGGEALFFNVNAADPEKRREVLDAFTERHGKLGEVAPIRVLMHSLAFGTLKPFLADTEGANGHDAGRDGQQPCLLDAGPGETPADGNRRSCVCHDQCRGRQGVENLRSRVCCEIRA